MENRERDIQRSGQNIYDLIERLFPICRSLTGEGVRKTLAILKETLPLDIHEVPTGTECFDWTVPREWNIRDAYVIDPSGRKIIDFRDSNLHVVSYSVPVSKKMQLEDLKEHLHTLPDLPQAIPYKTSYYAENWGFCLSYEQFLGLQPGEYTVHIDATLEDGNLMYGEFLIPGRRKEEFLLSTYICHPSMCNDNLTGIAIAEALAAHLLKQENEYSYRFLFIPETIGSIAWLSRNEAHVDRIKFGLSLNSLGDPGPLTYKKSRLGDAEIDQAAALALLHSGTEYQIIDFSPIGSDERQYCSPGFNLPVGSLMRTDYSFNEYHTSLDDLDFISPAQLQGSFEAALAIINIVDRNKRFLNTNPKAEPQLGKRGLYALLGGARPGENNMLPIFWVLNLSDGNHNLVQIADRSGLSFDEIWTAAKVLCECHLLEELDPVSSEH